MEGFCLKKAEEGCAEESWGWDLQKHHLHDILSEKAPPTSGPTTLATAKLLGISIHSTRKLHPRADLMNTKEIGKLTKPQKAQSISLDHVA